MTLLDIITNTRRLIKDDRGTPRFDTLTLVSWLNLGLNDLRTKRPDAGFDINQNGITSYVLIDDTDGYYQYTDSSGYQYLASMQLIEGWIKTTYPVLYMKASSASNINIFPTSADRTATTNLMAHIAGCDTAGIKTLAADAVTLEGTVRLAKAVTSGNVWNITATEANIPCDDTFHEPLMYYVASKVYEQDSDDTANSALADKYYKKYLQGILS